MTTRPDAGEPTTAVSSGTNTRRRGRPSGKNSRDVPDRILSAAQEILEREGHDHVTTKYVAQRAATTEAMIHYYFGTRDELLYCISEKVSRLHAEGLRALELAMENPPPNPTQYLLERLFDIFLVHPAVARMMQSELVTRDSRLRQKFLKAYDRRAIETLQRILQRLMKSGIYAPELNVTHAAFTLLCIANAPLTFEPFSRAFGIEIRSPSGQAWVDYLTDLFERQFKKP